MHVNKLSEFIKQNKVDIAVITVPRDYAKEVADIVTDLGVKGIWNFTSIKFTVPTASQIGALTRLADISKNEVYRVGAVAPMPYRARKAENVIADKEINEALAEEAGTAAVADAHPFDATKYKVQLAKVMVKRALLSTIQK